MNYFRKKALNKIKKYQEEIEYLHVFRSRQLKNHGKLFAESWLSVAIDFRISKLYFKKKIFKRIFSL